MLVRDNKKMIRWRKKLFKSLRLSQISTTGFTMIEIVVMLAIITAISAVVLVSFSGLNEGGALNRSARELALNIRRAQNNSLSVTEIAVGSPSPVKAVVPAVGVELALNQNSYFLFADLDSPNPRDNKYDGLAEKIDTDQALQKSIKISSLVVPSGSENLHSKIDLIFTAPESSLIITDPNSNCSPACALLGNSLDIVLKAPTTGQTKTLTVRTSGQITIK